jgi:membrane carboxypeptidase/penicillin-binding protein PbpC
MGDSPMPARSVVHQSFQPFRLLAAVSIAATVSISAAGDVHAQEFMTQAELLATIPGHTIQAKTNEGVPWAQAYSTGKKKGTIKGVMDGQSFDAKWFVKGNQWCENWGDGQACWNVERVDQTSLRMYDDQGNAKKNLWKIQK